MTTGGFCAPARPEQPLFERERELAILDAVIGQANAGDGRTALIEGAAGIGKSRLLAEAARRAERAGMRVLAARGSELERDFPFGVVRQLFERMLADPDRRGPLLAGAAAPARLVFEPAVQGDGPAGDLSFASLHGLHWMAVNLAADAPLALAIDDLHWCDRPSLRWVAYLVRRLDALGVLVVAAARQQEPGTDDALLAEIAHPARTVVVRPNPLTAGAVRELVANRLGSGVDESFVAACHQATRGNPLLLGELLAALDADGVQPTAACAGLVHDIGPRAVSRGVLLRIARLPTDAATIAKALAVLGDGDGVGLATAAELVRVSEDRAAAAIDALCQAGILRAEPSFGFVHPLVRAVVYNDIPPARRQLQHRRAAQLLAAAAAPAEQVAAHLIVAPRRGEPATVRTLRSAARAARERGAPDSAVAYLRRALNEPPRRDQRPVVLLELGAAEALTSGPAAAEHLQEALDATSDPVERARVAELMARVLLFTGDATGAVFTARRAAAGVPERERDLRLRLGALSLTVPLLVARGDAEASRRLKLFRAAPVGEGAGGRMLTALAAWDWAMRDGPAEQCAQLALRAIGDGSVLEPDSGGASFVAAIMVLALADRPEALAVCDASLAAAQRRGSLFAATAAHIFRGFTLALNGDLPAAELATDAAFEGLDVWKVEPVRPYPSAILADVLTQRGELAGARRALERAGLPDDPRPALWLLWWLAARARLLLAEGRPGDALEAARQAQRSLQDVGSNPAWMPWRSIQAEALDRLGRHDEALVPAREDLQSARRWGAPRTVAAALRVLGTIERETGIERLREAVATAQRSPARLEQARSLAALGAALRRARRPSDAREPLRRSAELAHLCGAGALEEHARQELLATGARPRRLALTGLDALTASERQVAQLAADGLANRDIARRRFVTVRTVEVHLTHAYEKLGIGSREELPSALRGQRRLDERLPREEAHVR